MSYDLSKLTTPLQVSHRIPETSDAVSLVFSVPKEKEREFRFGPGQFLTLFLEIDGEVLPRSYSICSSPLVERELKITVKRVPGGKGSNFILDQIRVGDLIRCSPPSGHFFRPPASQGPHHWVLAAAGSGITPIYSIMKTVLLSEPNARITLLFCNRSPDLVIYAKELAGWADRHKDKLNVIHVMSKPPAGWTGLKGRFEGELLNQILDKVLAERNLPVESYLCGPDQFMQNIKTGLLERGVEPEQVHIESFTIANPGQSQAASANESSGPDDGPATRVYIGDESAPRLVGNANLKVQLGGEELNLTLRPDQNVLEAIIEAGGSPPYSCLEGNCMACMGKVKSGRVYQDDPGILLEDNIANRETLTCQAKAASQDIHIDYDSI